MYHIAQEIVFTGNKPSKKQVFAKALDRVNIGDTLIEIYWGENSITLEENNGTWYGFGWIKDIEGDAIAKQLNQKQNNAILNLWNT